MEIDMKVDVAALGDSHHRALEEVLGAPLAASQQITIIVREAGPPSALQRRPQKLADWTGVYEGLSDDEVEAIDKIAKTRANLTRNLP